MESIRFTKQKLESISISDDIVCEIISLLPLKLAVQCKCLNKRFNAHISNPHFESQISLRSVRDFPTIIFHCSHRAPKIFLKIDAPHNPITLPLQIRILASSTGLLLLLIPNNIYCLTNPFTQKQQFITDHKGDTFGLPGLVVDPTTFSSPRYKLVTIHPVLHASVPAYQELYGFEIFASNTNCWRKSNARLVCTRSRFVSGIRAVELNGCLYWIRECVDIVKFDTKKEQAVIIRGPPIQIREFRLWFGVSEGLITIVNSTRKEIAIYVLHEHKKSEWRVKTRIPNIAAIENDRWAGMPIVLHGDQLLFQRRLRNAETEAIYLCDIRTQVWRKFGYVPGYMDGNQCFVPFTPTLAKVSTFGNCLRMDEGVIESIKGLSEVLTYSIDTKTK